MQAVQKLAARGISQCFEDITHAKTIMQPFRCMSTWYARVIPGTRRGALSGEPSVEEGYADVNGGRVWYRVVSGRTAATPLLLLHGGPGTPSYCLEPLAALADERPVIFYDQLGCGRSDKPSDPTLWRLDRFVEELGQIREVLDLTEVHLLGHSWGTMLATDYMLTRPMGVLSLILASPVLSVPRFIEDANRLRTELPLETQEVLRKHETAGTTDSAEYQESTMVYYKRVRLPTRPVAPRSTEDFRGTRRPCLQLDVGSVGVPRHGPAERLR